MWPMSRQLLETLKQGRINTPCTELVDQLIVVYGELLAIRGDLASDVPGSDNLRMCVCRSHGLDCGRSFVCCSSEIEI